MNLPALPTRKAGNGVAVEKERRRAKAQPVVEYLPDADEIERSPLPRYAQFTMHVLFCGIAVFFLWASLATVDQVITAKGRLVTPLPNVVVQPLETAVISKVNVRAGQTVKKGEVLATLDPTFAQADQSQLKVMVASLDTQITGLEHELAGDVAMARTSFQGDGQLQADLLSERRANYRAQATKLVQTAAKLRAAMATNQDEQRATASRLASLKQMEAMQEKMVAQKYAAPLQLLEAQQRTKEVERELGQAASREKELRRELAAFEAEQQAFHLGWRQKTMEELLQITRSRDSMREQLLKADRRQALLTLTSPIDGVVLEIAKLSPGSIVREAETFFTLVPVNAPLEAEVQIESSDIGNVQIGCEAQIKIDAFPFQKHGLLGASVRTVSRDSFRRDPNARAEGDAYYLSHVALKEAQLLHMKPGAALLPGMTLTAEISVGERTVLSYLAWPLTKGLSEAIREP